MYLKWVALVGLGAITLPLGIGIAARLFAFKLDDDDIRNRGAHVPAEPSDFVLPTQEPQNLGPD
jgi:hypothetical protein